MKGWRMIHYSSERIQCWKDEGWYTIVGRGYSVEGMKDDSAIVGRGYSVGGMKDDSAIVGRGYSVRKDDSAIIGKGYSVEGMKDEDVRIWWIGWKQGSRQIWKQKAL